jgi:uncharacterized protein
VSIKAKRIPRILKLGLVGDRILTVFTLQDWPFDKFGAQCFVDGLVPESRPVFTNAFAPPGRRGSSERDQQGLRAAIASMPRQTSGRVFLGGHSYGERQASMLAASEPGLVDQLLLLSYPLHPPQRPSELRTGHFPRLQTPAMFVHGTRDGFGSIYELEAALQLIRAPTELLPVIGAGHELVTKRNRDELPKIVVEAFRLFAYDVAA